MMFFPDITLAHPSGSSKNHRSFHDSVRTCQVSMNRSVFMVSSLVTTSLAI